MISQSLMILHYFQIDEESEEWKLSHPSGITRKEKEMRDAAGLGAVAGGDDSLNINRGTRKNLVQQKLKEASGADLVPSRKSLSRQLKEKKQSKIKRCWS